MVQMLHMPQFQTLPQLPNVPNCHNYQTFPIFRLGAHLSALARTIDVGPNTLPGRNQSSEILTKDWSFQDSFSSPLLQLLERILPH